MVDSGVTRRRASPKAGSVWETRMKLDEFKGGIKVFNANHHDFEHNGQILGPDGGIASPVSNNSEAMVKQSPVGGGSGSGKRKTWKSDRLEGSPVRIGAQRSEVCKNLDEKFKESGDSADVNAWKIPVQSQKSRPVSGQLRKMKSDSANFEQGKAGIEEFIAGDSKNSAKSKDVRGSVAKFDGISSGETSRSEGEPGVCEVKEVTSHADKIKNPEKEEEYDKKIEVGTEEKNLEIEQMSLEENKPKKSVKQEKKLLLGNQKSQQKSPIVKFHQNPTNIRPIPDSDSFHGVSKTRSKLESFGDLIMWKDVRKSSFIFGMGTFGIVSCSYTRDLNISFISVVSYIGLAYVAVNFVYRSLISSSRNRGRNEEYYVIGEEEAICVLKLVLPYVNEFLLKFSGDPAATTMKWAVLLFALATCGSSITMWNIAILGFIGVFTLPKLCSSYSFQITACGTLWIRRLSDAWESCSHKKAVGFAIFSLVWNLSSVMARIWTVFMLYVAFKCYQHSLIRNDCEREQGRSEVKVT